jgi:hypothetical protein
MHGWGGALGSVDFDVLTASDVSGYKDIFGLLSYVMKCMKIWLTPSPLRGSGIMELGGEKLSKYGLQRGYR